MNLLFLGDIVGKPGRLAVRALLPKLIHREQVGFVIANCENISGGAGVEPDNCRELLEAGVDVLTSGNHIWRKREIVPYIEREPRLLRPANFPPGTSGNHIWRNREIVDYIEREPRLLRPANFPPGTPGAGWGCFRTPDGVEVAVVNLIGRVFMDSVDCPFQAAEAILGGPAGRAPVIFVDMHADATSEKGAWVGIWPAG